MGLRFRKSFKIAPGVKFNVSKKNVGVSLGTKDIHYSANTSGRHSTTISAPGTGLSYTSSSGRSSERRKTSESPRPKSANPQPSPSRKRHTKKRQPYSHLIKALKIFLIVCAAIALSIFLWIPAIVVIIRNTRQNPDKRKSTKSIAIVAVIGFISFFIFIAAIVGNSNKQKPQINNPQSEKIIETEIIIESEGNTETDTTPETEAATEQHLTETETSVPQNQPETIQQTEAAVSTPTTYYATDSVNVRSGPGTEYDILGTLSKRDRIDVQSVTGEWAEVLYNGAVAYAAADYLSEKLPQTEPSERLVWLPLRGEKYHSDKDCSGMTPVRQVTVAEAESLGYGPCGKCF